MKVYKVEIKEVLSKLIVVKADTAEEAKRLIEEQYRNEEIILDSSDYMDTEIEVIE